MAKEKKDLFNPEDVYVKTLTVVPEGHKVRRLPDNNLTSSTPGECAEYSNKKGKRIKVWY